jgi:arginyl-tRNA synthetase
MSIVHELKQKTIAAIKFVYSLELNIDEITVSETKPEFEGDYTIVLFGFAKKLGQKPDEIGEKLGQYLNEHETLITGYNIIKGFLNLSVHSHYFIQFLNNQYNNQSFGLHESNHKKIMIEYSSPNTNKPIHFGHLRNIFLGAAVSKIAEANGYEVIKANLINDRGIHICKSMIAWMLYGNGATPDTTQIKGDHLVGDYYVKFNDVYKAEIEKLMEAGHSKEDAEKQAPIYLQAQNLLRKWEANDTETISLWEQMNGWVYKGFDATFKKLGVTFDKMYYESQTYLLGKHIVEEGLKKNALFQKEDSSIWIDLTNEGLDQKLLMRGDGTSVYITQDIGTAQLKYKDYQMDQSVYVIGDEQNYHMQVLKLILQKLNEPYADGIYHLSYGMVELPSGKMKSREGNVVDADDMITEMTRIAQQNTEELGKVDGFTANELEQLYYTLGMGALKFYLLRVDPKKRMIFNPQESIDFHGFTGPFVQYTHARICSILRKAQDASHTILESSIIEITSVEKNLLKTLEQYPSILAQAHSEFNPAVICNFIFSIAKEFNSFLVNHSILKADTVEQQNMRLQICTLTKQVISHGLNLLGVNAPDRM